ncbi:MAG: protein BatD [Deltaproteobacteria bacterium]|nr:protein BatD [Deltaproteobacteria bacterium]
MKNPKRNPGVRAIFPRRMVMAGGMFLLAAVAIALFSNGSQAGWGGVSHGRVSAAIEPGSIAMGEAAILVVQVSGEQAGTPELMAVDGLRFFAMGRSSQYQSINGRVSATTSYLFQVQPEHAGDFVIPPVQVDIDGNIQKSEPVTLRVAQGAPRNSRGSALPSSRQPSQNRAPSQAGGHIKKGQLMSWEEGKPAFLRVLPRANRAYVGELLPMEIKAYFHQGVQASLRTLPVITGGAFACGELRDKPAQTEEILDGVPYNVLTWYTAMSAVKEGEHPVSAELDATLGIPEQSRRRSPFGRGLFDDDFFNGFFQNIREEPVKLTNPRLKIRVLPLPKMGRPKDFAGAVGQFTLSATATPQKTMVGDPITIKMHIKGTGNFDRVSTPQLKMNEEWKTYRPSASFKPLNNAAGYTGEKSFEQAVIPVDSAIKNIPPITFSYFNTEKEKYITLKTKEIPLTLTAMQAQPVQSTTIKAVKNRDESEESVSTEGKNSEKNDLAPIHVAMGSKVKSLRPLIENPWFMGAQTLPVGAIFLGLFFSRRQKRRLNDPGLIRQKQVKQKITLSIRKMDQAIKAHDVPEFFNACRAASQERLGEIWGQTPDSITLAEIKYHLGNKGKGMAKVFENADAAAYSGRSFSVEELRKLRDLVVHELKDLNHGRPVSHH